LLQNRGFATYSRRAIDDGDERNDAIDDGGERTNAIDDGGERTNNR
jgi:hypothetical protein